MPKGINVNWIKHLRLDNENRMVTDSVWFRNRISAAFSVITGDSSKLSSFIGTRDERVKGSGTVELAFSRTLTRKLTLLGKHDVVQLGAGENALTESNILSSILSRGGRQRLSMVNRADLFYEHEWRQGVTTMLGTRIQRIFGNEYVPLIRPGGTPIRSISDTDHSPKAMPSCCSPSA